MPSDVAIVRQKLSQIPGVTRTWFEWASSGGTYQKILVVEVDWDTDPNSSDFNKNGLEDIDRELAHVLEHGTTMIVHGVRIVPRTPT